MLRPTPAQSLTPLCLLHPQADIFADDPADNVIMATVGLVGNTTALVCFTTTGPFLVHAVPSNAARVREFNSDHHSKITVAVAGVRSNVRLLRTVAESSDFRFDNQTSRLCYRLNRHFAKDGEVPTKWSSGEYVGLRIGEDGTFFFKIRGNLMMEVPALSAWYQDAVQVTELLDHVRHQPHHFTQAVDAVFAMWYDNNRRVQDPRGVRVNKRAIAKIFALDTAVVARIRLGTAYFDGDHCTHRFEF